MVFFQEVWNVSLELAPWLYSGAVISALLHKWLPSGFIQKQLTGYSGIIKAVFLGVPLPLCSCGVIPAGIGLKRDGASDGSSMAFLISTPQTGVDSVLISAAFLGWPFTILKVFAATTTGILGGVLCEYTNPPALAASHTKRKKEKTVTWSDAGRHGVQLIRSIWGWLLVGILLSAAITTIIPKELLVSVSDSWLSLVIALVISLPMYVCATASVPIAAALVTGGLPLNAALVFLMAGPASNVATIGAIYKTFGKRNTVIYLSTVIFGSLFFAAGFDFLLTEAASSSLHEHHQPWKIPFAILLLASFVYFTWEDLNARIKSTGINTEESETQRVWVQGLHCGGCVQKVKSRLLQHDEVHDVQITLESGETIVHGSIANLDLENIMTDLGYTVRYPKLTFAISGIHCGGCVKKLESTLRSIEGVDTVLVQREPDLAKITGKLSSKIITDKFEDMGYSWERVTNYGY